MLLSLSSLSLLLFGCSTRKMAKLSLNHKKEQKYQIYKHTNTRKQKISRYLLSAKSTRDWQNNKGKKEKKPSMKGVLELPVLFFIFCFLASCILSISIGDILGWWTLCRLRTSKTYGEVASNKDVTDPKILYPTNANHKFMIAFLQPKDIGTPWFKNMQPFHTQPSFWKQYLWLLTLHTYSWEQPKKKNCRESTHY